MKQRIKRRAFVMAAVMVAACNADSDISEPPRISKMSPSALSTQEAWRLFDRSVASQFTPGGERVTVTLDHAAPLRAFKVFGPAPYRMDIRGQDGGSLGFDKLDMSVLSPGWHVVASRSPIATSSIELRFEAAGAVGGIPELELWAQDDHPVSLRKIDLAARTLADGFASFPAASPSAELTPGDCAGFAVSITRSPAEFRRAYLVYDARGVFRPFAVVRSIDGLGEQGGQWLPGDGESHTVVDEIDPTQLLLGSKEVTLCLPGEATTKAAISNLRVVGELDRGIGQASAVTVGADRWDGGVVLDGDTATTLEVSAGERVNIAFDRLIAPDALVLSGTVPEVPAVDCVDPSGASHRVPADGHATATGKLVTFEGSDLACMAIAATFPAHATIGELDVVGSGAGERVDWPRLVITSPREHFGATAWVGGFVARPQVMTGAIRVDVAGQASAAMTGDFGRLLVRTGDLTSAWPVAVVAHFPDGTRQERQVVLDGDHSAQLAAARTHTNKLDATTQSDTLFGAVDQSIDVLATPDATSQIRLGTQVGVDIPAGALAQPTTITVSHLGDTELPPLDPGLANVTAPKGHAYEFLPHGQHFIKPVEVIVPFDPTLIPDGMKPDDIHTYFFDPDTQSWKPLTRDSIDIGQNITRSATNHFTIMINAVLAVPTDPKPLSFDPTALSAIGAASPGAGIDLIEPPQASSGGDAHAALPIRVPAGRGAYTPLLDIAYSSAGSNSWLGFGWNLELPRVEIDTRWGVPTYGDGDNVRYLLHGAEIVPTLDTDGPTCQGGATAKRYHARIEGSFAHILRCGDSPSSYHWEVHDRDGTLFVFGESAAARLASYETAHTHNGIFAWGLERVVDVHGNTTRFHYAIDDDTSSAEPSRELYPASIDYTESSHLTSAYSIVFDLDDGTRPDRVISGRAGFKVVTRHLLRTVHVKFRDQVIRDYVLTYAHGQFDKSVLASVKVFGAGGCAAGGDAFSAPACSGPAFLDQHTFDYFQEDQAFSDPVTWQVQLDPDATAAALGKGATSAVAGGAGVTFGDKDAGVTVGVNGSYAGRKEFVGIFDMNGDGLPDEVFDTGGAGFFDELLGNSDGSITVLYNQARPGIDPATSPLFAGSDAAIKGLAALGAERHTSWGASASSKVPGSIGFSESTSRARRFLADLDGDGFIDLVNASGNSLRGTPCQAGRLCFAPVAFGVLQSIDPRTDPLLRGFAADIRSRLVVGDPVVQWVAPFDGTITVTGTARKIRAGGVDGVTVEVYHQDTRLDGVLLGPDDTSTVAILRSTSLSVRAGEAIYLRVKTGQDDGIAPDGTLFDQVDARLSVQYVTCTGFGCGDDATLATAREPTGAPVYGFDSHDDLRIAGMPAPLVVMANGTLDLHASLAKQPALADLRVCVQRFAAANVLSNQNLDRPCASSDADVTNLSGTLPLAAGSSTPQALDVSADVQAGQLIMVRVESDLSFDPGNVALQPSSPGAAVASYSRVCLPNLAGTGFDCSTDPAVIATVPLPLANFGAFVSIPNSPPAPPLVAPADGAMSMVSFAAPGVPFVFAVRSDRHGILSLQDCTKRSCGSTISAPAFTVFGDESITFELVTPSGTDGPASVQVVFNEVALSRAGFTLTAPLVHRSLNPTPVASPFGGGYRGFRAAFWNEAQAFAPTQLLADLQTLLLLTDDRKLQIARSIVPPSSSFGGFVATGGAPAWVGPQSVAFVSSAGLHASPIGLSAGAGTAGDVGGVFDRQYARLSGTKSFFVTANLVPIPGFSFDLEGSASATDTTTDVVDMNGDGVLDAVMPLQTVLGALTIFVTGAGSTAFNIGDQLRHRAGHEYAVGFGDNAVVRRTRSGGSAIDVDNPAGPDTGFLGLSAGLGLGLGRSQTTKDLVDVNGDGLPDIVERSGTTVRVQLNLGGRFGAAETFGQVQGQLLDAQDPFEDHVERNAAILFDSTSDALQHESTITTNESGGFDFVVVGCSHSTKHTSSRITRQLADINGDGLPDLLYKKDGENQIRVQLNRGGDFGPVISWATPNAWPVDLSAQFNDVARELLDKLGELTVTGPNVLAGTGSQDSTSNGCNVFIPIVPEVIGLDFSGSVSGDKDTYELALFDIDGDGVADHVLRKGQRGDPGTVYVKHNLVTGKANLLKAIHRPLGGTVTLDYTRTANTIALPHSRQVLSRVRVDDGVDLGASFASPDTVTDFTYENGNYDRHEKQFFGFAKVTTRRADGVTIEDFYDNSSFTFHGSLLRETRRDGDGHLFHQRDIIYGVRDVTGADGDIVSIDLQCVTHVPTLLADIPDACLPRFPVIVEDNDTRFEGGSAHKTRRVVTASADRDRFGNELASTDFGDDAIASDDTYTQVGYQNDTTHWILGRATSLSVRAGGPTGTLLRSRTGDHDALGELKAVHVETGSGTATTTLGYDDFGNLNHVTTAPNELGQVQTYDVTYDADVATYAVTTIDAFGDVSTASYDLRFGIATSEIDINHVELRRVLDDFGRIARVFGPYDTSAPGLAMEYHPDESPPRAVTTMHPAAPADYTGPVPAPITTVIIADGVGRAIELRRTSVVDGVAGMTTSGLVARDTVGRVVRTQNPFFTAGASTGFVTPQTTLATALAHDALDRTTFTQYPDGATETASFDITTAPGGAQLFKVQTIDPDGHARESFVDHTGRTRVFVEHPTATSAAVTSYDYLATGELSHVVDPEGNPTVLGYDLEGRRTSLDNPDSGLITSQFDLMGNRIVEIEPNHRALGTRIHYIFERDRLSKIDYPSKPDVSFSYGPPGAPNFGAGRVVQVSDETGNQQHSYGALGELRRTVRTFTDPAHEVGTAVFDLRFTTDSFARQLRVAYPDGEVVTNTYDAAGLLNQVDGQGAGWSRTYVKDLRYDVFGNQTRAQSGNGDVSVWTFDPARIRLSSLVTTLASSTRIQDLHYTYDPASNPTAIDNNLPASPVNNTLPGTATQTFSYDGVDRLLHASGAGTLGSNKRTTYDLTFGYSASDNLLQKTAVHQILSNGGSAQLPSDTNYASTYTYAPGRPHLPTQVGSLAITYDPSGNPLTRTSGGPVQQLTWDDDNRLVQVQGLGANQRNLYDANGLRVLRHGRGNTIFSSAYFEYDNAATGTKHIFAGHLRVASVLAKFTSGENPTAPSKPGTAFFFHDNHLGSTAVVTTEAGDVHDAHEYFPDGGMWIESGKGGTVDGFLFEGKPLDPDTGFYDFGQRFYDPKTSLWLGIDDKFRSDTASLIGKRSSLALVAFSGNNPLRFIDPDGRDFWRQVWNVWTTVNYYTPISVSYRFSERVYDVVAGNKSVGTAAREQAGEQLVMASALVGGRAVAATAKAAALVGTGVTLQTGSVEEGATAAALTVAGSVVVRGVAARYAKGVAPKVQTSAADQPVTTKPARGAARQALGAAREARVAELTRGSVSGEKISAPSLGSTDIDVVAQNGNLVMVGGPSKAANLGNLGRAIRLYQQEAARRGVGVQAYFAADTPQSVLDFTAERIGKQNVARITE